MKGVVLIVSCVFMLMLWLF